MYELYTFDPEGDGKAVPSPPRPVATRALEEHVGELPNPLMQSENRRRPQMSLVARYMALDPTARDLFEERAAVLEYDAGLPRPEAERRAFAMVVARYRDG